MRRMRHPKTVIGYWALNTALVSAFVVVAAASAAAEELYFATDADPSASDQGSIRRVHPDGGGLTTILSGNQYSHSSAGGIPEGLAIDLLHQKLYFSDSADRSIRRSNLAGTNIELLVNTPPGPTEVACYVNFQLQPAVEQRFGKPSGIALDLPGQHIYWVDPGLNTISRANLDGSNPETVVSIADLPIDPIVDTGFQDFGGSIALDATGRVLYFVARTLFQEGGSCGAPTSAIVRVTLDSLDSGHPQFSLVTSNDDIRHMALDLPDGHVYLAVGSPGSVGEFLARADLSAGYHSASTLLSLTSHVGGLTVIGGQTPRLFWTQDTSLRYVVLGSTVPVTVRADLVPSPRALTTDLPPGTNQPPVVNAGNNVTIATATQANTTLHGTVTDPESDALHYRWLEGTFVLKDTAPVGINGAAPLDLATVIPLSVGEHLLTLEATDGQATTTDTMILTVNNSPPTVAPTGGGTVQSGVDITLRGQVADYDGDTLSYRWFEGPATFAQGTIGTIVGGSPVTLPDHGIAGGLPLGTHTLTLEARDGTNPPVPAEVTVEVVDTQAPTLQPTASLTILWPPDHRMVAVTIQAHAADNSGQVTLSASVSSSEPPEVDGSGNTVGDFTTPVINQATGVITLQLRAERSGQGDGRVYTVTITATDNSANASRAIVQIVAPHDRGKK